MGILGKMVTRTAKGFVVSSATALAVTSISKILGKSDSTVAKILAVGVPLMAFVLADDPQITDLLFKDSKKKDRKKDKSPEEAEEDFFNIFGDKGHAMNKAIAGITGTTEEEVNGVMSLFLPTFEDAIAEEDPEDSKALGKLFKDEVEDIKERVPSFAKMATKLVF